MLHIPYRGIAPAFTDLLGGQTQAMFPASRRRFRTFDRAGCGGSRSPAAHATRN